MVAQVCLLPLSPLYLITLITNTSTAGNIGTSTSKPTTPESLTTPTIKQSTYTTGRGGTGNMALNDPSVPAHAEMARASQDVGAPAQRQANEEGQAFVHWGRGGAANMMKVERKEELPSVIEGQGQDGEEATQEDGVRRGSTDKLRIEEVAPGSARAASLQGRGGSVAEGTQSLSRQTTREGRQQQQEGSPRPTGRRGSSSIVEAGRGILNRLRSPSAKRKE